MPSGDRLTPDQRHARSLAALDQMAGVWADAAGLTRAVAVMLTHDDRESRIEAFIKQAFVEGAWAGTRRLNVEEIAELGRGTGGKNG